MSYFSEWVKRQRTERGLTQKEFAGLCGMHQSRVAKWECDEWPPSLKNFATMIRALGMDDAQTRELLDRMADDAEHRPTNGAWD